MSYYDPVEHLDDADRNDWEVRQHLWAQRQLQDVDRVDTRAKVEKMLADVVPKARVCTMLRSPGQGELGEGSKQRTVCGRVGVRMIATTGDWTCAECDPLRGDWESCPVCDPKDLVGCTARDGPWGCCAGLDGHARDHRFMRLEGE